LESILLATGSAAGELRVLLAVVNTLREWLGHTVNDVCQHQALCVDETLSLKYYTKQNTHNNTRIILNIMLLKIIEISSHRNMAVHGS
jgi:hypothetical protein